jgi:predicted ATPase
VILGANGAGKSSVVRAFAVAMIGPNNAIGLNQVWREWQRQDAPPAAISATVVADQDDYFVGKGRTTSSFDVDLGLKPREGSTISSTSSPSRRAAEPSGRSGPARKTAAGSPRRSDPTGGSRAATSPMSGFSFPAPGLPATCRPSTRRWR